MASPHRPAPDLASVDHLIDEKGSRVDVPDGSTLRQTDDVDRQVGNTGPTAWFRLGFIVLGALALVLLVLQLLGPGAPNTDVVPGTPTTPPASADPAPPA